MPRNIYNPHSRPPDPEDYSAAELDELDLDPEAALDDSLADEPAETHFIDTPTPVTMPPPPAPRARLSPTLRQAFQHARPSARPSAPSPTAQMRLEGDRLAHQLAQQHVQAPASGNIQCWEDHQALDEARAAFDGSALTPHGPRARSVFNPEVGHDTASRPPSSVPASQPQPRAASPIGPTLNNRSRAYASADLGVLVRLINDRSPFSLPPREAAARWVEIGTHLQRSVDSVRKKAMELLAWHQDNGCAKAATVERCLGATQRATLPALLEAIMHDRAEAKALTDEQRGQRKQKIDHERRQAELLRQQATGTRGHGSACERLRDADDDQEARLSGKGKAPEDASSDSRKHSLPSTPTRQQHKRRKIDDDTDPFLELARQGQAAQERQCAALGDTQRIAAETSARQVQITADLLPTLGQIAQSVAQSLQQMTALAQQQQQPASSELPFSQQPASASGSGSSQADSDGDVPMDDVEEDVPSEDRMEE